MPVYSGSCAETGGKGCHDAYFVTGNDGSEPVYGVKSVSKTAKNKAQALITVRQKADDREEPDAEAKEYEVQLKLVDGQWLLDDFDDKKAACRAYVREVREKYASGAYVKYLESSEDLKEFVPDFLSRVDAFYAKYGK